MSEYDFKECPFIHQEMRFYLFEDFVKNCFFLKALYDRYLSINGKVFYKWYVYANIDMSIYEKNLAWDYLNGYCTKADLTKYLRIKKARDTIKKKKD